MDGAGSFAPVPSYYNLGFVVFNQAALRIFREHNFSVQDRLRTMIDTPMRCQIAVTLISYRHAMHAVNLPAIFNAANDLMHATQNAILPDEIKVLHYLRNDEIDRCS